MSHNENSFQAFQESLEKERQQLRETADERARRQRLGRTLNLLTHPQGSENVETIRPELWTDDAWTDRFLEMAQILKDEGVDRIQLSAEAKEALPLPFHCAVQVWELGVSR